MVMAGFDPYSKNSTGIDWDNVLRAALTLTQICVGIIGIVFIVTAFVLSLEVFEFIGTYVDSPAKTAAYIKSLKEGPEAARHPAPPLSTAPHDGANTPRAASADEGSKAEDKRPANPAARLRRVAAAPSPEAHFERIADRVLFFLLMGVYALVPVGLGLVGLKIVVAMIRKRPPKPVPEEDAFDEFNADEPESESDKARMDARA
jgi:hypothetical protein